eukprot:1142338-Pelagomonas_calceolata.AAC.12
MPAHPKKAYFQACALLDGYIALFELIPVARGGTAASGAACRLGTETDWLMLLLLLLLLLLLCG